MDKKYSYRPLVVLRTLIICEVILWAIIIGCYALISDLYPEFRFGRKEMLYFIYATPLLNLIFFAIVQLKKRSLARFADASLLPYLIPDFSRTKPLSKFLLFKLGFVSLLIGLSMPQFGLNKVEAVSQGIDIMLAVDVSNSMKAEDLKPNRLERAKLAIEKLLKKLGGDRIGIITFGGIADVHVPITTDYVAVKTFLASINTNFPVQGTAIGAAINMALKSFDFEKGAKKAVIIITDGENHEGDALAAVNAAKEKGVIVHTIGMGSTKGVPIPEYVNGRQVGFKKDRDGNTVVTKLNESMLKQIAEEGNGIYVKASNASVGLDIILKEINSLEKTKNETIVYADYEDHFQIFLAISFVCLILDQLLSERKIDWLKKIKLSN